LTPFSSTYAGGNLISFRINSFTNAPSSGGAGISLIETYLRNGTNDYLVDQVNSTSIFVMTPNIITQTFIGVNNKTASNPNTEYTFTF